MDTNVENVENIEFYVRKMSTAKIKQQKEVSGNLKFVSFQLPNTLPRKRCLLQRKFNVFLFCFTILTIILVCFFGLNVC
jgi:hypothetical protein